MFTKSAKIMVTEEDLCRMAEEWMDRRTVEGAKLRVTDFKVEHERAGGGYSSSPTFVFTTEPKDGPTDA